MATVYNFSLGERDQDIIDWLERQPNRSAAIREAIRRYVIDTEGPTLADVLAEIRSLPGRLSAVAIDAPNRVSDNTSEPEVAAANLDGLLGRLGRGELG